MIGARSVQRIGAGSDRCTRIIPDDEGPMKHDDRFQPEPRLRAGARPFAHSLAAKAVTAALVLHATMAAAAVGVDPALAPFTWLEGCWRGEVNQREFREFWMPARAGVMIGVGQQSLDGKLQDYEYLRLEAKDGVTFSQFSGDRKVYAFKLASTTTDQKDTVFTFDHTEATFPAHLTYRKGVDGWLYETVDGTLDGKPAKVIYPLRRVSCETGEIIAK